jgi:hypothetical protein
MWEGIEQHGKGKIAMRMHKNSQLELALGRQGKSMLSFFSLADQVVSRFLVIVILAFVVLLSGCKSSPESSLPTASQTTAPALAATLPEDTATPQPDVPTETATPTVDLSDLPGIFLCEESMEGAYCIFSLGFSSDQQLVTIKHAESAAVDIVLRINGAEYYCQSIEDYPGNLYCIGPLITIFEDARVEILSQEQEALAGGLLDLPYLEVGPTIPSDDPGYY